MRKCALLLAAVMIVSAVPAATAQQSKSKHAEPEDPNANGKKLLIDGLPLIMPSAVMYYMLYQKEVEYRAAEAAKTKKSKK
jgi:hypothetical protein